MSQNDLADAILVSSRAVAKWESGQSEPSMENIVALSKIFGVTSDYLLGLKEESKIEPVVEKKSINLRRPIKILNAVFGILIALFLIAATIYFTFSLIMLIYALNPQEGNALQAGVEGIGRSFESSEYNDMVAKMAINLGLCADESGYDAASMFLPASNALNSKYTLHGDTYWFNGTPYPNYPMMIASSIVFGIATVMAASSAIEIRRSFKGKPFKVFDFILTALTLNVPSLIIMIVDASRNDSRV